MNFDEYVQVRFDEIFADFGAEMKPIVVFRGGYSVGFADGFTVKEQVESERARIQQQSDRDVGHNQGLAHAAFLASHFVLPANANEAHIRELIVAAIEAANVADAPKTNGATTG